MIKNWPSRLWAVFQFDVRGRDCANDSICAPTKATTRKQSGVPHNAVDTSSTFRRKAKTLLVRIAAKDVHGVGSSNALIRG